MSDSGIYFDDLAPGEVFTFGPYRVEREEMLAFSRQWDPLPVHLDEEAARAHGHRGVTASGQYTMCVKQALLNRAPWRVAVIGAMGFDELRFPQPVYPGDDLTLRIECLHTRASRSKPDRGIVKFGFQLDNQHGETVLAYLDTVMFARGPHADANPARAAAPETDDAGDGAPAGPAVIVAEAEALPLATKLLAMKRNGVDVAIRVTFVATRLELEPCEAERIHDDFEAGIAAGFRLAMGMPPPERAAGDEAFYAIATQLGMQDVQSMMDEEQRRKARRKRRTSLFVAGVCVAAVASVAALFLIH